MLTHRTRFCLEKFKTDIVVNRKKFPMQDVFFLAIISQFLRAEHGQRGVFQNPT